MHDEPARRHTPTKLRRAPEPVSVAKTVHGRKHRATQAASFWRPLRRRDATIARPARVRMRSRKPCLRLRRRLFGWYVRLLTAMLPYGNRSVRRSGMTRGRPQGPVGSTATAHPRCDRHSGGSRACDRSRSDPTSQRYGRTTAGSNSPTPHGPAYPTSQHLRRSATTAPDTPVHPSPRCAAGCGQPVERCEDAC